MTAPISGYTPINQVLGTTQPSTATAASKDLDQDTFLKLLVAQLRYQDPMNPAQGTEFLSQTAQFTQVEKLAELADVQREMLNAQLTMGAGSLVGRTVTYTDAAGNATTGVVTSASVGSGSPTVRIGEFDIPFSQVSRVANTPAPTPTTATAPTTTPTTPTTTTPTTSTPSTSTPTTPPTETTEPVTEPVTEPDPAA